MSSLIIFFLTFGGLHPDTVLLEGGDIRDLALTQNRIYAATGRGLVVFDEDLHRIGSWNSPGNAGSVAADSFIFIADGDNGLAVLDTGRFQPIRTVKIEGTAQTVRCLPPYLLVGTNLGLARYRGEEKTELDRMIPVPGGVGRFQVNGDLVYALSPQGVTIINLGDSSAPLKNLPLPNPVDLALTKEYLYVASDSGLVLFTLADPRSPKKLRNFIPPGPIRALAINQPYIYLATEDNTLVIFENRANQMLHPIQSIATTAVGHCLGLADNVLYAGESAGLDRWTVEKPSEAAMTGSYRFDNPGIVSDVAALGKNAAAVGSGSGLWIVDPAGGTVVKRLPALHYSDVVTTRGDTIIFVVDRHLGVLGFDLPKPDEPIRNYINSSGRDATTAAVVKDRLLVAGPKELHEYEICPCKALSDKVVLSLASPGYDVTKVGGLLLVALGDSGIVAVESTKTVRIPIVAHRMLVQSNLLYTLDRNFGLRIYTFSSIESPKLLAELKIPGTPEDFILYKNNLYVAAGRPGIYIVNVLNPASPKEAGSFDTPGDARRLARVGTRLLVADHYSLEILKLTD